MANSKVFFSDLKSGRCSSVVEARLLRFWEAGNFKRCGEFMWADLLMIDINRNYSMLFSTDLVSCSVVAIMAGENNEMKEMKDEQDCKLIVLYSCAGILLMILSLLFVRAVVFGAIWILLGKRVCGSSPTFLRRKRH
ncbi:hypothetical protein Bca52824_001266 [Brassica carinata]|uniref:Transmembrane protein n=1 Tax=Brassica carinata TaxID=52824 RepID=A0A8X7WIG2_BRACI|nr:hypothetical protein Bca52824_001266 [Brassica carinata]